MRWTYFLCKSAPGFFEKESRTNNEVVQRRSRKMVERIPAPSLAIEGRREEAIASSYNIYIM